MAEALAMVLALAIDLLLGEPRRWHPVAGIGNVLLRLKKLGSAPGPLQRPLGVLTALTGPALVGGAGWGLHQWISSTVGPAAQVLLLALLLKPALSLRMLFAVAQEVEALLLADRIDDARTHVAHHLVSRDTTTLEPTGIRQATISSLAENSVDSVVAPLFWFAVGGLGGAWAYRWINTADAVIGYRTPELERIGWAAARLDDAANWVPARLTGGVIWLVSRTPQSRFTLTALRREAARTPSPNGGWSMGAVALAGRITLSKPGVYTLNPNGRAPDATGFAHATNCLRQSLLLAATFLVAGRLFVATP